MKDQKKNNKGFSLVELIVVVAIMAVLLGVLVPTLVRNVEKSKKQKDISNLSELRNAIQTTMASEKFSGLEGVITISATDGKFTLNSAGTALTDTGMTSSFGAGGNGTKAEFMSEVLANVNGGADYQFTYTSKLKDGSPVVTFIFKNEKVIGNVTVSGGKYQSESPIQLQDDAQSSTAA